MNVDHNTSDKVAHLGPESQGNVGYFWEEELLERIVLGEGDLYDGGGDDDDGDDDVVGNILYIQSELRSRSTKHNTVTAQLPQFVFV